MKRESNQLAPPLEGEDHSKDMDFSPAGIRARWDAGYADTQRVLARAPWTGDVDPLEGFILHEAAGGVMTQDTPEVGEATDALDDRETDAREVIPARERSSSPATGEAGRGFVPAGSETPKVHRLRASTRQQVALGSQQRVRLHPLLR